jgi:hypothetical protein
MDEQLNKIIDMCWNHFVKFRDRSNSPIVNPSIPILWFGDLEEYQGSAKRIVTLAINPSNDEFRLDKNDSYGFVRFKQGRKIYFKDSLDDNDRLVFFNTLNKYYKDEPYRWFKRLEAPLNCLNATYGGKFQNGDFTNYSVHIDLCPLSTSKKWRDVDSSVKEELKLEGITLLHMLLEYLKPQIILASISQTDIKTIFNLNPKRDLILEYKNDSGGFIRKYIYTESKLIVGRNMKGTAFGGMTNDFIRKSLKEMEGEECQTDSQE